jgi:hypothetical protein
LENPRQTYNGYLTSLELPPTHSSSFPHPEDCPSPHTHTYEWDIQALRVHISKCNRKTAEKNPRTSYWKGASNVLTEYRKHPHFSKKDGIWILKCFFC